MAFNIHTSSELRSTFLNFFGRNGHEICASGPLIPENDPTLMFAAAGMVQFKDLFLGVEKRNYKRATTSQKCIRISGKHNDLEAVGPSPRHHTFFEMLGNFSFGDYFKEEAILFAWDFLTKELALPKERLIFTYFRGEQGLAEDTFARDLWRKVSGFGPERVRGLGMSDNFWQAGETGPCGPSSEIFFCNGPNVDPHQFGQDQTVEGYGWMEIWNLVFMQFERSLIGGEYKLDVLPAPSIDTGAGLERLACVTQGKTNNYDTDILRRLVDRASELSRKRYGGSMDRDDVSMRVIADHARTTAFLIAEGVMPDRTGREYVLRRVMRRAIRHGHRLGIEKPFLHEVALSVVDAMGDQYPELRERRDHIASVAEGEEVRFRQTIERGLSLLEERFDVMAAEGKTTLPGADAFKLYDTYGFPLDLTNVICLERGFAVDEAGYDAALETARERSEFKSSEHAVESVYREALAAVPNGVVRFTGYEKDRGQATLLAIVKDGALVHEASAGDSVDLVCDSTPFYAESGGQVGDQGAIQSANAKVLIADTYKPVAGLVVHRGKLESGTLTIGDGLDLIVDSARRDRTRRNHSATHLLHWALRTVLGSHAQQKGSLVGPERLRFDFTSPRALTPDEISKVEDLVNHRTLANHTVRTEVLNMEEARARGAMMIFEEKYGDVVRMLSMAESTELCGGNHARATGDIGLFKIISEQGVSAGVRRIIAVTGDNSLAYLRDVEASFAKVVSLARATPANVAEKVEKLLQHERALEKQIDELQRKLATGGGGGLDAWLGKARDIAGVKVLGVRTEVTDRAALRELAEQLRDKLGQSVVLVGSVADGKAQLVLTVAKDLTPRLKAGELIKNSAQLVGGSGGGRPDMAQAGGTNVARLDEAIEAIYQVVG